MRKSIAAFFALLLLVSMLASVDFRLSSGSADTPHVQHVVLVMMENKWDGNITGNPQAPYENSLIKNYAFASNYYAVAIDGLEDYLGIFDGTTNMYNHSTNCTPSECYYSGANFFSLMQDAGLSWKGYAESMPSSCYPNDYPIINGGSAGEYWPYHTAIPYFSNLGKYCSANDVPLGNVSQKTGNFFNNLGSSSFANFTMISPDVCDDMHSCPISTGDHWLSELLPNIIDSKYFASTVILITFDNLPGGQVQLGKPIPMFVVGPSTLVNYGTFGEKYTHYSTLATLEDIFNLPSLGNGDASATPMSAIIPITPPSSTSSSSSTFTTSSSSSSSSSSTSNSSTTVSSSSSTTTTTPSTSSTTATASSSSTTTNLTSSGTASSTSTTDSGVSKTSSSSTTNNSKTSLSESSPMNTTTTTTSTTLLFTPVSTSTTTPTGNDGGFPLSGPIGIVIGAIVVALVVLGASLFLNRRRS